MKKILSALVLVLFTTLTGAAEPPSTAPLFAATLNDLDDRPVALAHYRGKPLVVNFWARWCAPCRAEIPELIKFRAAHQGKIEVLGIGIEDEAGPAKEFAKTHQMNYPAFVAKDKGIPLMQALANTRVALPYTLFVDRRGQVIKIKLGQIKPADLEGVAGALLKP